MPIGILLAGMMIVVGMAADTILNKLDEIIKILQTRDRQ